MHGEGINHIQNCKECSFNEKLICDICNGDRYNFLNKCIERIENCEEYNEDGYCQKCIDDFELKDDKKKCFKKELKTTENNGNIICFKIYFIILYFIILFD